ncbi:HNH endonuclease signature motif containing protein [Paenibacillus agilis]|uniref:HNH endonuclease n=1 Tax=Paenibacillus agilis TaxID=3020863 RepID=A0A559IZJ0_9BACL|nr:HNH endonuclease signature motif containing protein [Paenibacillus agilis]TVX93027.1 HNH endonuclease [Paenibacillus agilis]
MFRYTTEMIKFITNNVSGRYVNELTDLFNVQFGTTRKNSHIRAFIRNHGLKSGIDARFNKGHEPANKGTKGLYKGGEATQFKKGHRPHNYRPVGSERVNGDDYVDVKVADPNKWKSKHILIWEQHNGAVPKGHIVIFGDGNRRNFELSNLILVSRQQLAVMNKNGLIQKNAELTRTGIIIADIYRSIGSARKRKTKSGKGREKR